MTIKQTKADLLQVLLRRRWTVERHLASKNIKTHKELKAYIKNAEKEYHVSEDFKNEAYEYIDKLKAETSFEKSHKEPVTETKSEAKTVEIVSTKKTKNTKAKRTRKQKKDTN